MKHLHGLIIALLLVMPGCGEDHPLSVGSGSVPAPVDDLRASVPENTPYESTIQLRWTVPNGPPIAQYEVRASTAPLHADEWLTVDPAMTMRAVQPPGGEESVVMSGLQQGRLYYFVVRSANASLGWSSWSNVATLPTMNMPPVAVISASTDSLCITRPIVVNAATSTDLEDGTAPLEARWDWEDDGTWDTDWMSTQKTATHFYVDPALYTVRLEVRDRGGATGQATQTVMCGAVLLRSAYRLVGHLEEIYDCNPSDPGCYPALFQRKETTNAYGPADMSYDWTDQISLVDVDTLSFDGVIRSGIMWPLHANWVYFDVTFEACIPVDYDLVGQADCKGTSFGLSGPVGTVFAIREPCGSSPEFSSVGRLAPGRYRVWASLATDEGGHLAFTLRLHPTPWPPTSALPADSGR